MVKRRICGVVIIEMLERIPSSETEFREDLGWNYDDSLYKAPEETIQWRRTMETLMKHIPQPYEDWQYEVLSIFTTKSIEQLKKEFKEYFETPKNGN